MPPVPQDDTDIEAASRPSIILYCLTALALLVWCLYALAHNDLMIPRKYGEPVHLHGFDAAVLIGAMGSRAIGLASFVADWPSSIQAPGAARLRRRAFFAAGVLFCFEIIASNSHLLDPAMGTAARIAGWISSLAVSYGVASLAQPCARRLCAWATPDSLSRKLFASGLGLAAITLIQWSQQHLRLLDVHAHLARGYYATLTTLGIALIWCLAQTAPHWRE